MHPGPLILAAVTAGALAFRWRRLSAHARALAVAAVVALAVWGSGAIHPPNLEHVARDIGASLGYYTYAVVGLFAFLETGAGIGLIAPGELAVVIGGVTAGQGHTNLFVLIGVVWVCALAGDLTSYVLGRRLGRGFLLKHGAALKLTPERLEQVEEFLRRHGGKTIIVGRFIGLVRALAPFAAGSMNMPARRFVPAVFVAAGLWAAAFTGLGYVFWQSFDRAAELAKRGTFVLVALVVAVALLVAAYRYLRTPEQRRRARERLRELPIVARLRKRVRRGSGTNRLALHATAHCLTGCAAGEVLGLVIGTAAGMSNGRTILLAIVLAFLFGYTLTSLPLLHAGMSVAAVVPVALAADTISITVMEIVDNATMLVIPGALDAGLGDPLFWVALVLSLGVAGAAPFPANKWLLQRGRGHARVHAHRQPNSGAAPSR